MTLRAIMFCAFSLGAALDLPAEAAEGMARVSISLPPETAQLKTGPGKEYAEQHCQICHSVDYIYMQPPLNEAQWRAIVVKMKKVMGAPLTDADIDPLVHYLLSQNGAKSP